jgi:LAS superfamily LD-carboxypeptidase LdcB
LTDLSEFIDSGLGFPVLNAETKVNVLMRDDLVALVNKAHADNNTIYIRSGYRSYWEQQYSLNKVSGDTSKVALPGQSQHQLGLAVDFSTPENQQAVGLYSGFENTKLSQWLVENSWKYGFVQPYVNGHDNINPAAEPQHYLYVGREMAAIYREFKESGWEGDIFDLQGTFLATKDGTYR